MRIGVVGVNHKLADLKLREILAKACQRRFGLGHSSQDSHYFVLLSTCNRTEIYFYSDDLASTHTYLLSIFRNEVDEEFDQKLYSFFGNDCFLHLARVTAGLDSAIVAETEIQGQVRNAYETATKFTHLPEDLHYLFQKSLKIGKKIRTVYLDNHTLPEIEHAVYRTGLDLFKDPKDLKILFVGASEINQKILHFLKNKTLNSITLCNRSHENAVEMANQYQLKVLNWDQLDQWQEFDWIIFGTKAPNYLLRADEIVSTRTYPKLIIDLSVPRNVDPEIVKHSGITLFNIDQINRMLVNRKQKLYNMLAKAEQYVLDATKQQVALFYQKQNQRQRILAVGA